MIIIVLCKGDFLYMVLLEIKNNKYVYTPMVLVVQLMLYIVKRVGVTTTRRFVKRS
jgi:hypothetical protein